MNLKAIDRAPVLDPKEAEKKEKSLKGIIYNVPGKASIEISMNKKTLYKGDRPKFAFKKSTKIASMV